MTGPREMLRLKCFHACCCRCSVINVLLQRVFKRDRIGGRGASVGNRTFFFSFFFGYLPSSTPQHPFVFFRCCSCCLAYSDVVFVVVVALVVVVVLVVVVLVVALVVVGVVVYCVFFCVMGMVLLALRPRFR